jgi:hypothetical protein
MKKLEILNAKLSKIENQIELVSFERKDTSYRRSGGYFGTNSANLTGVIVYKQFARTKNLNTYICVSAENESLVNDYKNAKLLVDQEYSRLNKIAQKKFANASILRAKEIVEKDIANGITNTNYAKCFIIGNKNIYYAHPYYGHSDYNKAQLMPNTPKHRKVAAELNQLLYSNGVNINQ